jgi:hypothetical protein
MEFTFKSKFNLEDIVWFMYDNKPAQGIVCKINYRREESVNTACEHKNIFNKLKSLLSSKKVSVTISYEMDMVRSDGTFISCTHYRQESEMFRTKEELLKSL